MSTSRLLARTPSARPTAVGRLDGYELRFHKRSKDGSAKADAFRAGSCGDMVWGVVYELPVSELRQLDKVEAGYKRAPIDIIMSQDYLERGTSVLKVWAYLAEPEAIEPKLQPYTWYKRYVVVGAREHALPSNYVTKLESVPAVNDPDPERAVRNACL